MEKEWSSNSKYIFSLFVNSPGKMLIGTEGWNCPEECWISLLMLSFSFSF